MSLDEKEQVRQKQELIRKATAEASSLETSIEEVLKKYSSDKVFDLQPLIEATISLRGSVYDIGYPQLFELVNQFEMLIVRESMRSRMGLRTLERTAQIIPFFKAVCARILTILNALALSADQADFDPQKLGLSDNARKRRVIIIDDSKTFQVLLKRICESNPDLEVVGVAPNAEEGGKLIERLHPDVVTLDVHMEGMDGFKFIDELMKRYPISIVMTSSLNVENGAAVFDALYQGVIDFIRKSNITISEADTASTAGRIFRASLCSLESLMRFYCDAPTLLDPPALNLDKVIAIGAAIGSTRTLIDILRQLPPKIPAVLISQRIVPGFSKLLIQRLNEVYPFVVKEAEHGERIEPMKVMIAPEGVHMSVIPSNQGFRVNLSGAEDIREKPSADVLFDSVAICFGAKAVGVLLPGSGLDGAEGLLEIRKAGGYTLVQDELDCPDPSVTREAVRVEGAQVAAWGDHVSEVLLDAVAIGESLSKAESVSGTLLVGEGPRILVVDDSPTIRSLVRHNLRALGLSNFTEAKDGMEAWRTLISGREGKFTVCHDHLRSKHAGNEGDRTSPKSPCA